MPTTRTLAQLRAGVLRRANLENDPNAEDVVDDAINASVRKMWSYKVEENAALLTVATPQSITATTGTQSYALPAGFGQLVRLDRVDGTDRVQVLEAPMMLEADFSRTGSATSADFVQYRVIGGGIDGSAARLFLLPDPGTFTYELWYVQSPQTLVGDGALLDVTYGEEDYVEARTAAELCERQDRPSDVHRRLEAESLQCCKRLWRTRDKGRPNRVINVRDAALMAGRRRHPRP
jgi:hypothetical protein